MFFKKKPAARNTSMTLNEALDINKFSSLYYASNMIYDSLSEFDKNIIDQNYDSSLYHLDKSLILNSNDLTDKNCAELLIGYAYCLLRFNRVDTGLEIASSLIPKLNPIGAHFAFATISEYVYRHRDTHEQYLNIALYYSLLDFDYRFMYIDTLKGASMPAWKRAITILEKKKLYMRAIEICNEAIKIGVPDSTKSGYRGNLNKLLKIIQTMRNSIPVVDYIYDSITGEILISCEKTLEFLSLLHKKFIINYLFEDLSFKKTENGFILFYGSYDLMKLYFINESAIYESLISDEKYDKTSIFDQIDNLSVQVIDKIKTLDDKFYPENMEDLICIIEDIKI